MRDGPSWEEKPRGLTVLAPSALEPQHRSSVRAMPIPPQSQGQAGRACLSRRSLGPCPTQPQQPRTQLSPCGPQGSAVLSLQAKG